MNNSDIQIIDLENATIAISECSIFSNEEIERFELSLTDRETFLRIKNERRRREWVISRMLLQKLLNQYPQIIYLESGKPILNDNSHYISITHSRNHIAVMVSNKHEVALDIEDTQRRISHLYSRYINSNEVIVKDEDYFKIWCAKEAIYKLLDHPSIELKEETTTDLIKESILFARTKEIFRLNYIHIKNDLLCYIIR